MLKWFMLFVYVVSVSYIIWRASHCEGRANA